MSNPRGPLSVDEISLLEWRIREGYEMNMLSLELNDSLIVALAELGKSRMFEESWKHRYETVTEQLSVLRAERDGAFQDLEKKGREFNDLADWTKDADELIRELRADNKQLVSVLNKLLTRPWTRSLDALDIMEALNPKEKT
jgi:hypothetical protein